MCAFGPFAFFFIITEVEHYEHYEASLGRFSFIILILLLTVLFARVFDLRKGIAAAKLRQSPGSWLSRLRYLWFGAAVCVPLLFAGLAFNGYFYTALMLLRRMGFSIWVVFIAVVLNDVVLRWLLLALGPFSIWIVEIFGIDEGFGEIFFLADAHG